MLGRVLSAVKRSEKLKSCGEQFSINRLNKWDCVESHLHSKFNPQKARMSRGLLWFLQDKMAKVWLWLCGEWRKFGYKELFSDVFAKLFQPKVCLREKRSISMKQKYRLRHSASACRGNWRKFLPRRCAIPEKSENYRVWPLPWMMYL